MDAFEALRNMLAGVSKEAVPAAEDAAARVYLSAARDAAPRDSGQLRSSIKIIEGKDKKALSVESGGSTRRRLFVGPEKKKGYYGFFVEKGHKTAGPRRIKRRASGNTHSQSGVASKREIPAKPWFEPAIRSAESQAIQAAEVAYNGKLAELNGRK